MFVFLPVFLVNPITANLLSVSFNFNFAYLNAILIFVICIRCLCSGDEDQAQERINKLAKILKEQELSASLRSSGVGVISCIIQRDEGRAPMRHSFHWSAEKLYFEEDALLRHLEPPLSIYLELVR